MGVDVTSKTMAEQKRAEAKREERQEAKEQAREEKLFEQITTPSGDYNIKGLKQAIEDFARAADNTGPIFRSGRGDGKLSTEEFEAAMNKVTKGNIPESLRQGIAEAKATGRPPVSIDEIADKLGKELDSMDKSPKNGVLTLKEIYDSMPNEDSVSRSGRQL